MERIPRIKNLLVLAFFLPALVVWSGGRQERENDLPVQLNLDIESRVQEWLENQDSFEDTEIFVRVTGGEVALEGEVSSYTLKQRAELEVRNIPGVTSVRNRLRVAADVLAGQKILEEQVRSFLSLNPETAAEDVEVEARSGVVTLSGTVDTLWKKRRAGELALEVVGVSEVINRILVVPMEEKQDREVAEQLAGALSRNSAVRLENIDISVRDGVVTLSGTVHSRAAADAAVQAAELTMGVKEVKARLTVQREEVELYSDLQIKAMVMDQLFWDSRVDEKGIEVEVEAGVVTLSGEANSSVEIRAAVNDARQVPAVRSVINDLAVGFPKESFEDRILAAAIRNVLSLNQAIDVSRLDITVRAGEAVLQGNVDTLPEKLKAERLAGEVRGVVNVVNEIAVVPTEDVLDRAIAEEIVGRIDVDPNVQIEDINVVVENGRVILSGVVRSRFARQAAYEAATGAQGVTAVENNIIVGS